MQGDRTTGWAGRSVRSVGRLGGTCGGLCRLALPWLPAPALLCLPILQAEAISSGEPADPGAACGEPLPFLINELPAYPADPAAEYAFNVEPFAPVLTVVKVREALLPGWRGWQGEA